MFPSRLAFQPRSPGRGAWSPVRALGIALVASALLYVASLWNKRITPALASVAATASGSFTEGSGWYPGEPFANAVDVRAWGSWSGSDENTGTIAIGPFPAPRILRFGLGGYPNNPGNALHVERTDTGEKIPVLFHAVGERWHICDLELPRDWRGRPVRLVGSDQATALGGWFALTEPIRGGRRDGNNALLETYAAWAINGFLLGILFLAAGRIRSRVRADGTPALPPHWIPLAAGALVAVCGYVVFWSYFVHPWLGWTTSGAALAAGIVVLVRRPSAAPMPSELPGVIGLMVAIGAFHLAVLHLFPTAHDFYTLAANRFRDALPADNVLSHVYAERLFAAESPRNAADDWQSSDRPPLQIGWQLLTWPASKLLQLDRRDGSGTSAVWFQLLWVAAAYGLLRTFRLTPRRAAGWVAVLGLCGFFLQNTTFTWPKLSAAAFATSAVALLLFPRARADTSTPHLHLSWAALFAGLAWLSHGGVAFSFLPLVPWLAWRAFRRGWRPWLPAIAVFAALVLPWLAYQKFYDPPGTRLLKWHLAGQTTKDDRGTWETIRAAYAEAGVREAWKDKVTNFHHQVFGHWGYLFDVSPATQVERRNEEFFHLLRALTWWPFLALFAAALTRNRILSAPRDLGLLAGWLAATIVLWCLLMFGAYNASIHHGSYAVPIALFVLFSVILERAGCGWLALLAVVQAITLGTTWAVSNPAIHGPPSGLPLVIATFLPLAWLILRALREPISSVAPDSPSPSEELHASRENENSLASRALAAFRAWWLAPRLNGWVLAAFALLFFLRKPHALLTPQLWAEDGSIFLMQNDLHGIAAFTLPYAGYLHTIPRLVAWFSAQLLDPAWWPAMYNGISFAIWLAVAARFFSARFDVPGKPWLALAVIAVPHTGEVFFNVTNLQWLTALVLIQQVLIAPPTNRAQRVTDILILTLIALTGPFAIVFLPLFAWRWWRTRTRDNTLALATVFACAALQAWLVVRTGPRFDFQSAPVQLWPNLVILARRLFGWPLLGRDLALGAPPVLLGIAGTALLAALAAWTLRPGRLRLLRAQVLAAFALITLAAIYRTRPDTWAADNIDFGDRYFYLPRVLLAWLLVWEFHAAPRGVAVIARSLCLAVLCVHLREFTLPAPKDYAWSQHVDPIRRGVPANIPTLPEGWTLEYRGRRNPQ